MARNRKSQYLILNCFIAIIAIADISNAAPGTTEQIASKRQLAIGVNSPIGWIVRTFAVSAYGQLSHNHGLRLNVATFPNPHTWAAPALAGDGGASGGVVIDVGGGWTYYPRRFLDGFGTELGVLYRRRDVRDFYDGLGYAYIWKTRIVAARALVSWNWRIRSSLFISLAVGGAVGVEKGTQQEITAFEKDMMPPRPIRRQVYDLESYLRIGYVFGL